MVHLRRSRDGGLPDRRPDGSLLAFNDELDGAFNRSVSYVDPSEEPLIDPLVLRQRLLEKLPEGAVIDNVSLHQVRGESTRLYAQPPPGAKEMDDEYFVHPSTGEVLGSRRWGSLSQGMTNFMPFVYTLHQNLALGKIGSILLGIVALLWTIDCFVGAYLTFPPRAPPTNERSHAGAAMSPPAGARLWLARWSRAWLVKTTKLMSLVFSFHRASGLWVWGMLLVFAWSGVALSLYPIYRSVTGAFFEMPEDSVYERLPRLERPKPQPSLSYVAARAQGRLLMEREARRLGFQILREDRLRYHARNGHFQYRVRSDRDVTRRYPQTSVWFDGDTGEPLGFQLPDSHSGVLVTNWLYALHWGSWATGGLIYRVFVCALGLVVTALSATGVWIWWVKRKKRATGARSDDQDPRSARYEQPTVARKPTRSGRSTAPASSRASWRGTPSAGTVAARRRSAPP